MPVTNNPSPSIDPFNASLSIPTVKTEAKKTEAPFKATPGSSNNKRIMAPEWLMTDWNKTSENEAQQLEGGPPIGENGEPVSNQDGVPESQQPSNASSSMRPQEDQLNDIQDRLKVLKEVRKELKNEFKNIEKSKPGKLSYNELIEKRETYRKEYNKLKNDWESIKAEGRLSDLKISLKRDPDNLALKKQIEPLVKTDKLATGFFNKESVKKVSLGKRVITKIAKMVFSGRISKAAQEITQEPKNYSVITENLDGISMKGEYGTQKIERYDIVVKDMGLYQKSVEELSTKKETLQLQLKDKEAAIEQEKERALQNKSQNAEQAIEEGIAQFEKDNPPVENENPEDTVNYLLRYNAHKAEIIKQFEPQTKELLKEKQGIETQISKIDKAIEQWEQKSSGYEATVGMKEKLWIGSNYFRDLVKMHGYDEAVKLYTAIPVNMRYQSWSANESEISDPGAAVKPQEIGFIRLGVISDLRNGFTNLNELKGFAELPPNELNQALDQKIVKLKSMMAKLDPTKEKDANKIAALKGAIEQFEKAKDKAYLNEMIAGRRVALRDQFAHLVNEQVNIHGAESDKAFQIAHIALLDEKKKKLDATGWMHSEFNEMQDMEEIFKEYNGQQITFSDSFHIDENGGIHLPRPKGIPEDQASIKLETNFFNVSVGGSYSSRRKKKTYQPEVLERSMGKLARSVDSKQVGNFFSLKTRMEKGESTNETAEDLAFLLHESKIPFSIGCLSAKDRTKLVGEGIIRRHAVKTTKDTRLLKAQPFAELTGEKQQIEKDAKKAEERLMNDAWTNPNNASSQVLQDTTGSTVAKLGPHLMTKLSKSTQLTFVKDALFAHQVNPLVSGKKSEM